MAEDLQLTSGLSKEEKYKQLYPQVQALIDGESDLIANMANMCGALKEAFNFFWVGFYLVKEESLVLGPFQGPVACTRISQGKGVCGQAWLQKRVLIVADVEKFPGHISCNALSKSEIVLPNFNSEGNVAFVLDLDSDELDAFDVVDQKYLSQLLRLL